MRSAVCRSQLPKVVGFGTRTQPKIRRTPRLARGALLAFGAVALFACSDDVPTDPPRAAQGGVPASGRQLDYLGELEFERLAAQQPAFAGYFYEGSTLVVHVNRPEVGSTARGLVRNRLAAAAVADPQSVPERLEVRQVEFSFSQLRDWRNAAYDTLFAMRGITFLDLDEVHNRISVGVVGDGDAPQVWDALLRQGIPHRAIDVVVTGPVLSDTHGAADGGSVAPVAAAPTALTLRDHIRPVRGGTLITMESADGDYIGRCTLGFSARRAGVDVFITNSHCTEETARTDGTLAYQPSQSDANYIGVELNDRGTDWWCRRFLIGFFKCRHSDAALFGYDEDADFKKGTIARTIRRSTNPSESGSTIIDSANPYFDVFWADRYPSAGETVDKVGQKTGWTSGAVTQTCIDVWWEFGSWVVNSKRLRCQYRAKYHSDDGDSGSPVFKWDRRGGATLTGIHWGHWLGTRQFSPLGGIEQDLGSLDVLSDSILPPPRPRLTVTIMGPDTVIRGETNTWEASVTGGTRPYSYEWWTCPVFTDGWFLGLMVSDIVSFLALPTVERGNERAGRSEQVGEARRASAAPALKVRFRPHG